MSYVQLKAAKCNGVCLRGMWDGVLVMKSASQASVLCLSANLDTLVVCLTLRRLQ